MAQTRIQRLHPQALEAREDCVRAERWPSAVGMFYVTSLAVLAGVGWLPERFAMYGLGVLALSWAQNRRWRSRGGLLVRERHVASSVVAALLSPVEAISAVLLASVISGLRPQVLRDRWREVLFTGLASLAGDLLLVSEGSASRAFGAVTVWWLLHALFQRSHGHRLSETRATAVLARLRSARLEYALAAGLAAIGAVIVAQLGGRSIAAPLSVGLALVFAISWISMSIHQLRERHAREALRFHSLAASVASCLGSRHGVDGESPIRVASLGHAIALRVGDVELALAVEEAALLKNLGFLALSSEVLERTAAKRAAVGVHLPATCAVLRNVPLAEGVRDAILNQHERWDGRGQPIGLMRTAIPLSAQVLSAAGALERILSCDDATDEVSRTRFESMAAREFDPGLVACVLEHWDAIVSTRLDCQVLLAVDGEELNSPLVSALRTRLDSERRLFREVRQVLARSPVLQEAALDEIVTLLRKKLPVHGLCIVDASVDSPAPLVITTQHFDADAAASLVYAFESAPASPERFVLASLPGESATLIMELDGPCPLAETRLLADVLARMLRPSVVARRTTEAVRTVAFVDALTRLGNRRAFDEEQPKMLGRARATETPFALLVVDADELKSLNDTCGHDIGDAALCRLADVLRGMLRGDDSAARIGGDEFVVLLEACDGAGARLVMERIVAGLEANPLLLSNGERYTVRASIGMAVWPEDGDAMADLRTLADRRMYAAKAANKSRGQAPRSTSTF